MAIQWILPSNETTSALPLPPARRILSLCPSVTETLFAIGAQEQVAGRTRFCIHPQPEIKAITVVGGTKQVKWERVWAQSPDLALCVKEENTPAIVHTLAERIPVAVWDIETINDATEMVIELGTLTGRQAQAGALASRIATAFPQPQAVLTARRRAAYLIWKKPWMAAGTGTYINSLLKWMGWENAVSAARYPEITMEELLDLQPDIVLLSSEPYPFKSRDAEALGAALPGVQVRLVDGEMFSWYGARMIQAAPYLRHLAASA